MTADDSDSDVRRQARQAYDRLKSRIGEPMAIEMRVKQEGAAPRLDLERFHEYLGVANPIYRIEAILQAIEVGDRAAITLLLERLEREKDEWVIATIVRAVGHLGDASHVDLVKPFLVWEEHPRVVANAVEALSRLDLHACTTDIVKMVDHRDPRVQAAAVVALYPIERDAARVCLQAMARSQRAGARSAAAHCLSKLHDPESVAMLKQMAMDEPDPELRQRMNEQLLGTGRHL
jgi:HEAT repeat protein